MMRTFRLTAVALAFVSAAADAQRTRIIARPDADMQLVLDALRGLGATPIEATTPQDARRQPGPADAVKQLLIAQSRDTAAARLVPGVTTQERQVPGAAGNLAATVYTPSGRGPFPVILYFHGGGWVIGDRRAYDAGARGLAKSANAVVVSVDYRRAPEQRFPAAHDDALAAYRWLTANASALGGDARKLALAGESAGGNLAIATAVSAMQAKLPMPVHVLAVYPIAQADTTTASYMENANARPLNRAAMSWFFRHATRDANDRQDWRISLVRAPLRGLPGVTIITAELDPLRTDGELLEKALRDASVLVDRRQFDGVVHEFFGMAAVVDEAKVAHEYAGTRLRQAFGTAEAPPPVTPLRRP